MGYLLPRHKVMVLRLPTVVGICRKKGSLLGTLKDMGLYLVPSPWFEKVQENGRVHFKRERERESKKWD